MYVLLLFMQQGAGSNPATAMCSSGDRAAASTIQMCVFLYFTKFLSGYVVVTSINLGYCYLERDVQVRALVFGQ